MKGPEWTAAEKYLVKRLAESGLPHYIISVAIGRTYQATTRYINKMGYASKHILVDYTTEQVRQLFGFRSRVPVRQWIYRGWLRAFKATRGQYRIRLEDLWSFMEDDRVWFAWQAESITDPDLRTWSIELRQGKPRWLTAADIADRYQIAVKSVENWINDGLFPSIVYGKRYVHEESLEGFIPPYIKERIKKTMATPLNQTDGYYCRDCAAGPFSWGALGGHRKGCSAAQNASKPKPKPKAPIKAKGIDGKRMLADIIKEKDSQLRQISQERSRLDALEQAAREELETARAALARLIANQP